ncbi:MAG: hypothetical protein QXQ29_05650 [Candidatus Bathyarchaeia archaeon]
MVYLEDADRVAISEYDINSPIASALIVRELIVGYGVGLWIHVTV